MNNFRAYRMRIEVPHCFDLPKFRFRPNTPDQSNRLPADSADGILVRTKPDQGPSSANRKKKVNI